MSKTGEMTQKVLELQADIDGIKREINQLDRGLELVSDANARKRLNASKKVLLRELAFKRDRLRRLSRGGGR